MKAKDVSEEYRPLVKELRRFLNLSQCDLREKYDRLWVHMYFQNFEMQDRFSIKNMNIDFRLHFKNDPDLAFNQVWKVWSVEHMGQLTEWYYHHAKQREWLTDFVEDLLTDVRKEFVKEYYTEKYSKK